MCSDYSQKSVAMLVQVSVKHPAIATPLLRSPSVCCQVVAALGHEGDESNEGDEGDEVSRPEIHDGDRCVPVSVGDHEFKGKRCERSY